MEKQWIRIGTRESQLALWQAEYVKAAFESKGYACVLVPITSDGEIETVKPLYEMGVTGVFTKTLDSALLAGQIDIAVHSLKDVPTQLAEGITLAAVPQRGDYRDALVTKAASLDWDHLHAVIATSSIRRKAQWTYRYKHHRTDNIRGNINTRLAKLVSNPDWHGAIFAAVGIERIQLEVPHMTMLDWMIPAPSQGALGIVCRTDDEAMKAICGHLEDRPTRFAVEVERGFLRALMGGCATPIACHARMEDGLLHAVGQVISLDEEPIKKEIRQSFNPTSSADIAQQLAGEILADGGEKIIEKMRKSI